MNGLARPAEGRPQPYECGPELLARVIHGCKFPYLGPYCPVHRAWVDYLKKLGRA